jgi:hypothetical protein
VSDDETQAPVAAEPVQTATSDVTDTSMAATQTNEAPEATQPVEEKQTVEVNAEETVEDKLYAGKYKTPEELEKAYINASSEASRISQERAELTRILNEAFAADPAIAAPAQPDDPYIPEPDPVAEKVNKMETILTVQSFIMTHADADAAAMNEILTKDPLINQINSHEAKLEYAYAKSKNMTSQKVVSEAQKQGAAQAQAKMVEKQAAQVESARQQAQPSQAEEMTQDQMRAKLQSEEGLNDLISKRFPGIKSMMG